MGHQLIEQVEQALGWSGPGSLGVGFAKGKLSDPHLPERILTPLRLLDLVMRRSLADPQVRCFQNGAEIHPNAYGEQTLTRRRQSIRMVDMRRLGRLLGDGATLVLDQTNVFDPTMEVACRAWQWWSREHVQANVYLTTNDAAGFDLHWDDHDVLIVQLAGEKSWEVRSASRAVPMFRDAERNTVPSRDVVWAGTLHAGDVMHIPRGYWHKATRQGLGAGLSLHATFGFVQRTGVNWLAWLADRSRESELFRQDLNRWAGAGEQAAGHRRLAEAAAALLHAKSPAEFLAAREQESPRPRHIPQLPIFGTSDSVVCVAEFPPRITERRDRVEVSSHGKKLTFTCKALPALRLLLSGDPVRLTTAADVVGPEIGRVAEILTREELCIGLTPELSSGYTGLVTGAVP
ncbi:Cupin superfamily protein [Actinomadura rubteroloni]|uniref:Cupin superfamily protein n=1 Tax=Actinomadura rubteroloni TaxID=1926885 RepID=A0A2P4UMG6_9ACTN|nr:cupin domain-containing protein [Actinomadura rubteroloni]POM26242.1 Cupin superfamily protein [Actinomadura rubteroloni]